MEMSLGPMREIAVAGQGADERTHALVDAVWQRFDPLRVLAWGEPDSVPLLQDRPPVDGSPAAYVCEQFVCATPVIDVAALTAALERPPESSA